jgi:hypothetical protein
MTKTFASVAVVLLALALPASTALGQSAVGAAPQLHSFEFIGCSGDWDGKLIKPEVWRVTANNEVSFLTHQVAACGLEGSNPSVSSSGRSLNLVYELRSSSDAVVMCDCEYWAKFTFGPEAFGASSVTVGGQQAVLRCNWAGP